MDTARYIHGFRPIGQLMETVISIWPASKLRKRARNSPEETKMEPSARGYNWGTLFVEDINTGT
jgi:hypothetical protein